MSDEKTSGRRGDDETVTILQLRAAITKIALRLHEVAARGDYDQLTGKMLAIAMARALREGVE